MIDRNRWQYAVTQVDDIPTGSKTLDHPLRLLLDLRNWTEQFAGVKVPLQRNLSPGLLPRILRRDRPVQTQCRGVTPEAHTLKGIPGSFGKEDHRYIPDRFADLHQAGECPVVEVIR